MAKRWNPFWQNTNPWVGAAAQEAKILAGDAVGAMRRGESCRAVYKTIKLAHSEIALANHREQTAQSGRSREVNAALLRVKRADALFTARCLK